MSLQQAGYELTMDFPTMHPQDPLVGECLVGCRGVGRRCSLRHPSLLLPFHPRCRSGGHQVPEGARGLGDREDGEGQDCGAVLPPLGNVKTHLQ